MRERVCVYLAGCVIEEEEITLAGLFSVRQTDPGPPLSVSVCLSLLSVSLAGQAPLVCVLLSTWPP